MSIHKSVSTIALATAFLASGCSADSPTDNQPQDSPIAWSEPVEVASGQAYRGPWRMNESEFLYVDDPALALLPGGLIVAWVDNAEQDIYLQRFDDSDAAEFEPPVNVSRSPGTFSWLPRVAVAGGGDRIHVVWQEILFTGGSHGGEILVASSSDGGRTFSDPVNLSDTTAGAGKGRLTPEIWDNGSLDLVIDPDGRLVVAWTEYEGALRLSRSNRQGEGFSEPVHVAGTSEQPARAPALAVDEDNRIWLAWAVGDDASADIHLAYSDDPDAGFSSAQPVHPSDDHADAPQLLIDQSGYLHLVYTLGETMPFNRSRVVHSVRRGKDAEFSEPKVLSTLDESPRATASYPQMALAGGQLVVSWEHAQADGQRPEAVGFAVAPAAGEAPGPASLLPVEFGPGRSGGNQGLLMRKLDGDEQGRIGLGHSTWQDDEASRIWLVRGRIQGD